MAFHGAFRPSAARRSSPTCCQPRCAPSRAAGAELAAEGVVPQKLSSHGDPDPPRPTARLSFASRRQYAQTIASSSICEEQRRQEGERREGGGSRRKHSAFLRLELLRPLHVDKLAFPLSSFDKTE